MKLADKILEKITEVKHQNMKVRDVTEKLGTRKARLTIKEAARMLKKVGDLNGKAPFPKTESDHVAIKEAIHMCEQTMKRILSIKESRKKYK